MIDWTTTVTRLGFADEEAMWTDLYDKQRLSIAELAARFGVSRNTIRHALAKRVGKPVRGRGGANRVVTLPEDIVERVRTRGVMAVARELQVNYTTLYKRLRRLGVSVSDLRKDEADAEGSADAKVREQE